MRVEVFKRTNECWYGSYGLAYDTIDEPTDREPTDMLVNVIFNGEIAPGEWRTCVWGTDDFGFEIDCNTETEAWSIFLQIIGMEYVTVEGVKALGLYGA